MTDESEDRAMRSGVISEAPSPVQRFAGRRPITYFFLVFPVVTFPFWLIPVMLVEEGRRALLLFLVGTHLLSTGVAALYLRRLGKPSLSGERAPYMPWPRWAPGYLEQPDDDAR